MKRNTVLALLLLVGLLIGLGQNLPAQAGMFAADEEVTYKEYWMSHSQFTGGCLNGLPTHPNGTTYVEPGALNQCPKAMQILLPDNFASALKAEIYLDLWRNYDDQSARFRINGNPTVYAPDAGDNWSRSPWVSEIPLSSLVQGTNTFTFWAAGGLYHIHDISIRLYYDESHPLIPPAGGDVTPPDGALTFISTADTGVDVAADTGGTLLVNMDELTFKADVVADPTVAYVEFHAYYDGYDDDNDGVNRDWHNVNRNNWWPGGKEAGASPLGGTINHIGTVAAPKLGGTVSQKWDLSHIINQSGVRFKIRIVDNAGNVREAAGGVTPEYTLLRYYPVVYFTIPGFRDAPLHMSGTQPDTADYNFSLPDDLDLSAYSEAFLLGMYWKRPRFSFNGMNPQSVQDGNNDEWKLGIKPVNKTLLRSGNNSLVYSYSGSGVGHFVEKPGPMIVLRGNVNLAPDLSTPYPVSYNPAPNSSDIDIFATVSATLGDLGSGVDINSVIMSVNGVQVTPTFSGPSNNVTVSHVPTQPFPPQTQIPVTLYACDLAGNCMTSALVYSFTTEAPDLTPPVISNVNVATTDNSATVTWTTDEAAHSMIEYGLTPAYERPSITDDTLVTQHSIELTGLQTHTVYNFRLSSRDFNNNTATTANLTFQTKDLPGDIVSDDFSSCVLDSARWSYIDPLNDSPLTMTGTGAQISVPSGTGHDLWKGVLNSPRLMQIVTNQDFDVEAKFDLPLTKKTMSVGIFAQQDNGNYLRFNFQSEGNVTSLVVVNSINSNSTVVFTTPVVLSGPSYMRVNRAGDIWNVQYSTNGTDWTFATSYTRTLTLNQIGPFVGNTGTNPAHVNVIDYFINLNDPIENEDPPIEINLTKVGEGNVVVEPNKAAYACNEQVILTALPAPDWTFAGWSGALTGTEASKTLTMVKSEDVTATFVNNTVYTLNVDVVSNGPGVGGAVEIDPPGPTYTYGTPVTLTATPVPGWSFVGWSGDLTSTEPEVMFPITSNMDITATFEQDEYTLDTLIITEGVGTGGTIAVDPVQPTYLFGEPVTITVTPELGWTFAGWEGEGVSGTDPVLHLEMSQDVVAIARLVQDQYELAIDVINEGEPGSIGGAVLSEPSQDTYTYGQDVTVTAVPVAGWLFGGWAGDLGGTNPIESLEMTSHKAISATFVQQHYTVTVTTEGPGSVAVTPVKPYYLYNDIVTLTPVAEPGYEFALWSGDLTGSDEPATVVIESDLNVEALFIVDTTPIEITGYDVTVMSGTLARISWTTDVPGNSRVDWGETLFYEGGTATEEDFVLEHDIVLNGLLPDTFYYFKITSQDEEGNEVVLEELTFSTSASSGLMSDDFAACELSPRWTWIDPLDDSSYSLSGRQVQINVPEGTQHNLWSDGINVPRLMQLSNDTDFVIEVKFDSLLEGSIAMQGILVQQDTDNFLRFEFHKREDAINAYAATFTAGQNPKPRKTGTIPGTVEAPMYMRIERQGDKWVQWYKIGENGEWVKNIDFTFEVEVKQVGIYGGNTRYKGNTPAHTVLVDYFSNSAAPVTDNDEHYALNIGIEGAGTVARNPNRGGYYCGQQVTLTATPAQGWIFLGWSGDTSGSSPVRTFAVTQDMNITAQFGRGDEGYKLVVPLILR